MGVLILKLAGPLQSWGVDSRYLERKTRHEPTKSGIIGLLASALGRRREDPVDDLAKLPIAVRIDQPGRYERDFQTVHPKKFSAEKQRWDFIVNAKGITESLPLTYRYYLADAVFVVAVEVPDEQLHSYADAILHPAFPLYLGRRSCPPADKVLLASCGDTKLMDALKGQPWQATNRSLVRKHSGEESIRLEVLRDVMDAGDAHKNSEVVRDVPLSFSQEKRAYRLRTVIHDYVYVANPAHTRSVMTDMPPHDPMSLL